MLADSTTPGAYGHLAHGVLEEGRSRTAIFDFVLEQLPLWRDRPGRPERSAETMLNSQLCAHLNSAARKSNGWDHLQFRVEESDEVEASRKIDLVAAPAGDSLVVQGRNYSDFETILPFECKRLPVPPRSGRDEREYVVSRVGVRGGIQRYKEGKHGAAHSRASLIAYVQEQTLDHWFTQIASWIRELHASAEPGWSLDDALVTEQLDASAGVAVHNSAHRRRGLPEIHLRHLWVRMTP